MSQPVDSITVYLWLNIEKTSAFIESRHRLTASLSGHQLEAPVTVAALAQGLDAVHAAVQVMTGGPPLPPEGGG